MANEILLPGWGERLAAHKAPPTPPSLPLAPAYFADKVTPVLDTRAAATMVQAAYEFPISHIGMDAEYRFKDDAPLLLRGKKEWRDVRSIRPFCLAFAIISNGRCLPFVVDLRVSELLPAVQEVLDLPVPFVCHYAPAELFALWCLGLGEPRHIWDTFLAERALRLGRLRTRRRRKEGENVAEEIGVAEQAEEEQKQSLSLDAVAAHYGITGRAKNAKTALQESFLTKSIDAPLTATEIGYNAEDARTAAAIREAQRVACDRAGICETLDGVVMPWNVTAAEMSWRGVLFDRDRCQSFLNSSAQVQADIADKVAAHGIKNPGSAVEIGNFLTEKGLAASFPKTPTGRPSTSDDILKEREHLHPVLPLIRRSRKVRQLTSDPAVTGLITGADGRVHAEFRVLGAATGRTQARLPNLMGIGRAFRPLVKATPGYGIGDVDLSQIEIGIAAAVFHDAELVRAFNTGDVYVSLAKVIFADQIPPEDLQLSHGEFRKKYLHLRDLTKPLGLGLVYGMSVIGIAAALGVSRERAKELWDLFRRHYPVVSDRIERAREQSVRRGYAYISGLRRFLADGSKLSAHDRRALGNAYVQGTAGLVFFSAGNRLRQLYRPFGARLLVPVHDAFVFEAPLEQLETVAELTGNVMVQTVQEWFPDLRPRVKANIAHPECWNHDGHHDSVERFVRDPLLNL